ncbi:MAG: hypothetical protein HQK96_19265 [Nitrospirae bacterium]|nr:hypothetical protein [Nitrospirota bacterium]
MRKTQLRIDIESVNAARQEELRVHYDAAWAEAEHRDVEDVFDEYMTLLTPQEKLKVQRAKHIIEKAHAFCLSQGEELHCYDWYNFDGCEVDSGLNSRAFWIRLRLAVHKYKTMTETGKRLIKAEAFETQEEWIRFTAQVKNITVEEVKQAIMEQEREARLAIEEKERTSTPTYNWQERLDGLVAFSLNCELPFGNN